MSTQSIEADPAADGGGPLIPMPPLTPEALRSAVARIIPSRLPELNDHLARVATDAQATSSFAPLRLFGIVWGSIVNIERWPERAARFHACEELVADPLADPVRVREAVSEIGRILREATEEISG